MSKFSLLESISFQESLNGQRGNTNDNSVFTGPYNNLIKEQTDYGQRFSELHQSSVYA